MFHSVRFLAAAALALGLAGCESLADDPSSLSPAEPTANATAASATGPTVFDETATAVDGSTVATLRVIGKFGRPFARPQSGNNTATYFTFEADLQITTPQTDPGTVVPEASCVTSLRTTESLTSIQVENSDNRPDNDFAAFFPTGVSLRIPAEPAKLVVTRTCTVDTGRRRPLVVTASGTYPPSVQGLPEASTFPSPNPSGPAFSALVFRDEDSGTANGAQVTLRLTATAGDFLGIDVNYVSLVSSTTTRFIGTSQLSSPTFLCETTLAQPGAPRRFALAESSAQTGTSNFRAFIPAPLPSLFSLSGFDVRRKCEVAVGGQTVTLVTEGFLPSPSSQLAAAYYDPAPLSGLLLQ